MGLGVIITYGENELPELKAIFDGMASCDLIIAPSTLTDLGLLAALYRIPNVVVTGDTLGMHLGLWADKETIAIFGPSNPNEVIPKHKRNIIAVRSNYECSPCAHQVKCQGKGGCMNTVSTDEVLGLVKKALLLK
jgi:ADP-heptose:LPS heptosyltransferase